MRNVDFNGTANVLKCLLKGNGSVTLRLDNKDGADIATVSSTGDNWQELTTECSVALSGTHTVFLILKGGVSFDKWTFGESSLTGISSMHETQSMMKNEIYDLQGWRIEKSSNGQMKNGLYIVDGKKVVIKQNKR